MADDTVCWFCSRAPNEPEVSCEVLLTRESDMRNLRIPRCVDCHDAEYSYDRRVYLPTVTAFIALWLGLILVVAYKLHQPTTLAVEALGALCGAFLLYTILDSTVGRGLVHGRRTSYELERHPEVAQALSSGWTVRVVVPRS